MGKWILSSAIFLFAGITMGAISDQVVLDKQMQSTISGSHWSCCYFSVFTQSIETYNGYQYVAFYDEHGKVCVGRRAVQDTLWDTLQIQGYTTNTSNGHNTAAIGICRGDGTIHLSFDYHCAPINYSVSVKRLASVPDSFAWHGNLFGPVGSNAPFGLGAHSSVSYPYFVSVPDGRLQFFFRDGCCAHGDRVLYEYSPLTGAWISVGILFSRYNSISFTGEDAMYPNGYTYDKNNRLHITWCWRLDADCCNRDLCYAYSDDFGRTWYSSTGRLAGKANTSPINEDSTQVTVWNIPTGRGYINQCGQALDSKGRIHVVTWHVPDSASNTSDFYPPNAKYFHYWREIDGTWHRDELSTVPVAYRPHLIFDEFDNLFLFTAQTTIYGASADSGWRDWTLLFNEKTDIGAPGGGEFHEPTIDIGGWESSGILSTVSASLKVTDINIAYSSFQKLLVKVYSSADSAILKGFNIRVLRNDTLRGQVGSDGRGSKLLYLKPSIYNLVLSEIGFSPETLLHVDITNTLIDTHRVAAYLSPLPVIGLRIEPDSLVVYNNCTAGLQAFTIYEDGGRKTHPAAGLIWSSIPAGLLTVDSQGEITTGNDTDRVTIICHSTVTGFTDSCVVSFFPKSPSMYYWSLDEKSGQTASGGGCNGNTATLHGAPVWGPGKFGNALSFDGVDDYLSTSLQQSNPNVFTLSLWFKTTSTTGGKLIGLGDAQTGTSGHFDRHLYMNNAGKIYFGCYNGSAQTINTALAYNDNTWHHVAATLSGAGMALYIDSVLSGYNTNVTSGENYSGYWRMGFDDVTGWPSVPSSNYFSGQLDDIRVYDKALSASEIASLYDGRTENEPVVIAQENLVLAASPNPFNPSASISYYLPQKAVVSLTLYNLQGKLVRELISGMVSAGRHTVQVDPGKLASGVYICEFRSGATAQRLKLVLMR